MADPGPKYITTSMYIITEPNILLPCRKNTLTVTDNRTGQTYEIPIHHNNVVNATDFQQVKSSGSGILYVHQFPLPN